jgi:anti-anti-sigma regulatory factor
MHPLGSTAVRPTWERSTVVIDGLRTVLSIDGAHDHSTAPALTAALRRAGERDRADVVLEIGQVTSFDRAFLRVLEHFGAEMAREGRTLCIRNASSFDRAVFRAARLLPLVEAPVPRADHPVPGTPIPLVIGAVALRSPRRLDALGSRSEVGSLIAERS